MANNYWTSSLANDNAWGVCEEFGTTSENADVDNGEMYQATIRCNWANRTNVVNDILGNRLAYPRFLTAGPRARTASIVGKGTPVVANDEKVVIYEQALITITYKIGPEDSEANVISESLEPAAEFMTQDYTKFRWGSAGGTALAPEEAPGKLVVGFDYVQTRYGLATLPAAILTPGIVNQAIATATLLGLSFPIETLLYMSSTPQRTFTTGGTEGWNMTSRFSYRPNGWNKFWRPETQTWVKQYLATEFGGAEYKNYPLGDFSTVLV
jgi:hypothetical protein